MIGVDLSDASVKLVEVRKRRGRAASVRAVARILPPSVPGAPRRDVVVDELRRMVAESGWRGAPAAAAIGGNDVVVRRFSLRDEALDLLSALRLECRKHVSGPIEEAEIRYQVLGRSGRDGPPTRRLLVTVAPRLEGRRSARSARGGRLIGLRPRFGRWPCSHFRRRGRADEDEVVAYLDSRAAESHVTRSIKGAMSASLATLASAPPRSPRRCAPSSSPGTAPWI